MRNICSGFRLAAILSLAGCSGGGGVYEGIPNTRDFPLSESVLKGYLEKNDIRSMRQHAWVIFGALTEPSRRDRRFARWQTWYDKSEALAPSPASHNEIRLQLSYFDGSLQGGAASRPVPRNPPAGSVPLESLQVVFNREAYEAIQGARLYSVGTFQDCLRKQVHDIPDSVFPPSSIAIKAVWDYVSDGEPKKIFVWDGERSAPGIEVNSNLSRKVCVAADAGLCPQGPGEPEFRSVRSFYNVRLDGFSTVRSDWFPSGPIPKGYAILTGLHFATREQKNWVWATFWWHDHSDRQPFADGRPSSIRGVWRNYLMTVSYDMDKPREPDGKPHIAFNPYLEARFPDGVESNCMSCHRRASWIAGGDPRVPYLSSTGRVWDSDLRGAVVRGKAAAEATYFDTPFDSPERFKVSFLWSLTKPKDGSGSCPVEPSPPAVQPRP